MTDIVAAPISTYAVPSGMGINAWFDWQVILGVPFWLFIDAFLVFVLAAVMVYWWARIRKLNAVRGWADSLKNMSVNSAQAWIISRTQTLKIICMEIEDNILSYLDKTKIGAWHHNTREAVIRVGGVTAVIASEDYDQTRDIITEIALTDNCDQFNANQDGLKEQFKKEGNTAEVVKPIKSFADYEEFGRKALQFVHPNGLEISPYNIFNCTRFMKFVPPGRSHVFFGGVINFDAKELKPPAQNESSWMKYAPLGAVIIVVLIATIAVWMVPLA